MAATQARRAQPRTRTAILAMVCFHLPSLLPSPPICWTEAEPWIGPVWACPFTAHVGHQRRKPGHGGDSRCRGAADVTGAPGRTEAGPGFYQTASLQGIQRANRPEGWLCAARQVLFFPFCAGSLLLCTGYSSCGARTLGLAGFSSSAHGLSCCAACGI